MRKALTVGELLVAMTIIGVIAVLVIPGFLTDYHKKIYTTRLKEYTKCCQKLLSGLALTVMFHIFSRPGIACLTKMLSRNF